MRRRLALAGLLVAAPAGAAVNDAALLADAPAPTLSAYGLFDDLAGKRPAKALTPYALNTPLFSDYAVKTRYVYMPRGMAARYVAGGVLDLPVGAVLVKSFGYPADMRQPAGAFRTLETRLLIRKAGGWVALPYVWRADGSDADLKRAGTRLAVSWVHGDGRPMTVDYAVPNVNQCKSCHTVDGALSPIGPKARNLNGAFAFPAGRENQLAHWTRTGLLTGAPPLAQVPRTPVWDGPMTGSIAERARAYLDGNCGHCHNPKGAVSNSGLFLNWEETDPVARGIGKRPVAAGHASAGLDFDIAPGAPDHSILLHRMRSTEAGVAMPELGRSLPHAEGIALVRAYIEGLVERARTAITGGDRPAR